MIAKYSNLTLKCCSKDRKTCYKFIHSHIPVHNIYLKRCAKFWKLICPNNRVRPLLTQNRGVTAHLAPKWLQCLHWSHSSPHTKNLWKWFIFHFYLFYRSVVYRFHEIRRLRNQHVYDGVTVECAWRHIFVVRNVNMPIFQLFDFLHFYM